MVKLNLWAVKPTFTLRICTAKTNTLPFLSSIVLQGYQFAVQIQKGKVGLQNGCSMYNHELYMYSYKTFQNSKFYQILQKKNLFRRPLILLSVSSLLPPVTIFFLFLTFKWRPKIQQTKCLLLVKGLVICFYLGWSSSILQFRQEVIYISRFKVMATYLQQ